VCQRTVKCSSEWCVQVVNESNSPIHTPSVVTPQYITVYYILCYVTDFKCSQQMIVAVYSSLGFLHLVGVGSVTSKTVRLEADIPNIGSNGHRHVVQRPKSRINVSIIL
jgi:hypothetical protein